MEFEKFMETKMTEFLDKKSNEVTDRENRSREEEFSMFEITSDYSREINDALKDGNLIKAKQILEEVKNKYVQAADNTISKKRLYTIMEEIYEKIKDFEEGSGDKSLLQTIREYEEKGLFTKPDMFKHNEDKSIGLITNSITSREKELEELTTKNNFTAKDVEQAIRLYQEIKELVERIPKSHDDLKNKASERALNWFDAIRKMKNDLMHPVKDEEVDSEQEVKSIDDNLAKIRRIKEKIVAIHQDIQNDLDLKNLPAAARSYKSLKKLCESFPAELSEEKLALLAEALSVYEQIKLLKDELIRLPDDHSRVESLQQDIGGPPEGSVPTPSPPGSHEEAPDSIQKIRDDIVISEKKIDEFLADSNIAGAMKEYSHLKMLCKIFPKEYNPQEKVTLLASALASFDRIRKAKDALAREKKKAELKDMEEESAGVQFETFRNELGMKINHVKEFLAQKDSQSAIKAYGELKEFFNSYPDEPFDKKMILYDDILGAHLDMALLDKDFKNKSAVQSDAKAKEIRDGLQHAKELINKNRSEEASHLILELKHKTMMLPSDAFDFKFELMRIIEELEHKIVFTNNMSSLNQPMGGGA